MIVKSISIHPSTETLVIPVSAVKQERVPFTGHIRLVLKQPLHLQSLELKFKGRTDVTDWERAFMNHRICSLKLDGLAPQNVTLSAGVHEFPFEFDLKSILENKQKGAHGPIDPLPPSVLSAFGTVQYRLLAVLIPSKAFHIDHIPNTLQHMARGVLSGGAYRVTLPIKVERPIFTSMISLQVYRENLLLRGTGIMGGKSGDEFLTYHIKADLIQTTNITEVPIKLYLSCNNESVQIQKTIIDIVQFEEYNIEKEDIATIKLVPSIRSKPSKNNDKDDKSTTSSAAPTIQAYPFQTLGHVFGETPASKTFVISATLKLKGEKHARLKPSMRSFLLQIKHRLRIMIFYNVLENRNDNPEVSDSTPLLLSKKSEKRDQKQLTISAAMKFTSINESTVAFAPLRVDRVENQTEEDSEDENDENEDDNNHKNENKSGRKNIEQNNTNNFNDAQIVLTNTLKRILPPKQLMMNLPAPPKFSPPQNLQMKKSSKSSFPSTGCTSGTPSVSIIPPTPMTPTFGTIVPTEAC